jgi:hypothetical protein
MLATMESPLKDISTSTTYSNNDDNNNNNNHDDCEGNNIGNDLGSKLRADCGKESDTDLVMISFDEYGILIHESQISNIDTILKNTSVEDIERLRLNGQGAYRDFYSYPGCFLKILEVVNER